MDTAAQQPYTDMYGELFRATPPEVRSFLRSPMFDLVIEAIVKTYGLTDAQQEIVRDAAKDLVIQYRTADEVTADMVKEGFSQEQAGNIMGVIDDEIMTRALAQVEFYEGEDDIPGNDFATELSTETAADAEPEATQIGTANAPSPSDVLTRLKENMLKPSAIAPVSRDYSNVVAPTEAIIEKTAIAPERTVRDIDPYREIPEEK